MYENLTQHIPKLQNARFGEWVVDTQNDGTAEHPIHMPYVNYSDAVHSFQEDFYQFVMDSRNIELRQYQEILEENGIKWDFNSMNSADVSTLADRCVLALILGAIRADRFSEGVLLRFLEVGAIQKWLKRLKAIDEAL